MVPIGILETNLHALAASPDPTPGEMLKQACNYSLRCERRLRPRDLRGLLTMLPTSLRRASSIDVH